MQVCNLATVTGFLLSLVLNRLYLNGSDSAIFFLAPLLLLLTRDHLVFSWLTDQRRYFPLVGSAVVYLGGCGLWNVVFQQAWPNAAFVETSTTAHSVPPDIWSTAKSVAMLVAILPQLGLFLKFLFDFKHQSEWLLLCLMPLSLPGVLLSDYSTIRLLSVSALLAAFVQLYYTHELRKHGLRFI